MNSVNTLIDSIRKAYKKDSNPNIKLYSAALSIVFRKYTDGKNVEYASKDAMDEFSKLAKAGIISSDVSLKTLQWKDQPSFDEGRKIFHYEHCTPIKSLVDEALYTDNDVDNILAKSVVCWILKTENEELDKKGYRTKRDGGWKKCYNDCGIIPIRL